MDTLIHFTVEGCVSDINQMFHAAWPQNHYVWDGQTKECVMCVGEDRFLVKMSAEKIISNEANNV